jgi:predicted dithiol-disulfide oxidoreductase (DUF899 family)
MTDHKVGTHDEWLTARLQLLEAEKAHSRRGDELTKMRQELPWARVDKDYRFETDEGQASLADLFRGRSQLLVYHFMFGPEYQAGCPACSAIADGFNGFVVHLANHDVSLCAVSLAPLAKLQAYKQRMGWSFPWASSHDSDFNYDFQAAITEEQQQSDAVEYNFRTTDWRPDPDADDGPNASPVGTDLATYSRQMPGLSSFAREDGAVYHTYSTYARGLDETTCSSRGNGQINWFTVFSKTNGALPGGEMERQGEPESLSIDHFRAFAQLLVAPTMKIYENAAS